MSENKKIRVFSFSDRPCPSQPTGGPGGVNYRLLLANNKFDYIDNIYYIFQDVIIEKEVLHSLILNNCPDNDLLRLSKYYQKLHEYYRFTDNDIYLFHDVFSAYVFISIFKVTRTLLIYHQQGTLYKEWVYFNKSHDEEMKKIMDEIMSSTMKTVKYVAFPSNGAKESVIESDPTFGELLNSLETKVLYNGCESPDKVETSMEIVDQTILKIQEGTEPVFITVAALNEAKGVERIPSFLADVKAKYGPIRWIIVGDGVKGNELEDGIHQYGLDDNVIWIKERIPHDDIQALFMNSDFYILAHRYSIFDFSTIEAMHYGNIPILTPVGGNKEIITQDNGIFINDLSSCVDFDNFVDTHDLNEMKIKNKNIAQEMFSDKAFLAGYKKVIEELMD